MPALKAMALGAVAAIALPYIARDNPDFGGGIFNFWTIHPIAGSLGLHFSIPIFILVTLFAWALFTWTEE